MIDRITIKSAVVLSLCYSTFYVFTMTLLLLDVSMGPFLEKLVIFVNPTIYITSFLISYGSTFGKTVYIFLGFLFNFIVGFSVFYIAIFLINKSIYLVIPIKLNKDRK